MRVVASLSRPPSRPARTAMISARIDTAVSAGECAPMSRPVGAVDAFELSLVDAGLEEQPATPFLVATRAERTD